jgi:hypothetical protein
VTDLFINKNVFIIWVFWVVPVLQPPHANMLISVTEIQILGTISYHQNLPEHFQTILAHFTFFFSDGDEPLLSGTGLVSKDCSEDVLESWADVLTRWKSTKQPPKQLTSLVRTGIPEALRGEVWQRLAGVEEDTEMMENYRLLITRVG